MSDLERLCRIMGTFDLATGHAETMSDALDALEEELKDVLGHLRARREWVGLTYEDFVVLLKEVSEKSREMLVFDAIDSLREAIEAKLKEKNT